MNIINMRLIYEGKKLPSGLNNKQLGLRFNRAGAVGSL